ncbi:hypothetical protein ABZZ74_23575 [Streptomyces sp. NPDC006476]|uniref:hypothetical protein n=1 Tax=Streptomyces sp. NPDC006476 TaxID=3157175 RepID=UPI00339F28CC
MTAPTAVPLPRLGRCPDCPDEIRLRANGRLYAHGCPGDGTVPLLVLRPTFARWLYAQSKRRDERTNRLTAFAAFQYRGCTRAPKLHAGDMPWSSADELHGQLHLLRLAHGGGDGCDWMCRDLERAAAVYEQLAADSPAAPPAEDPGPVVRVFRRDTGWMRPDYTDFADCTSNFHRQQDGRPQCTAAAVWKVVEEHESADGFPMLSIGFYCDTDLPAEHRTAT